MSDGFPSSGSLLVGQVRYQVLTFLRTPVAVFFTVLLPLIMLVLFNALFGNDEVDTGAGSWRSSQFYVGGIVAFTIASATFTNLANVVPIRREEGVLKRWRGTPLPSWIYLAGTILMTFVIALVSTVVMVVLGIIAYGVRIEAAKLPAMVIVFLVGVISFAAMGMAVAGLTKTAQSASAIANVIILPMAFISDVFIPLEDAPRWLAVVGDVLPLKPFARSFQDTLNPNVGAPAIDVGRLAVVAAWGVLGMVVALRWFKWEPGRTGPTRRRRSRSSIETVG
ncbi:MAG: ABC transporter permease [Ilumatobacteraceae bacterium]